jgi:hypothetical protein
MSDTPLEAIDVQRRSGNEHFRAAGEATSFDVLDFWRWSTSDLVLNVTRGVLAEYIVAKALDVCTDKPREGWAEYDLETSEGVRIEVKSSAYLQSWPQKEYSKISFLVQKRFGMDPETKLPEATARRHAHVYVFAVLAHRDKLSVEPLDLSQWEFWAVPTRDLDRRTRSQHSITAPSLRRLAGEPVDFWHLRAAFDSAAERAGHPGAEERDAGQHE